MSKRADYNLVSMTYDSMRRADGCDVMVALIQLYSGKQLKDLYVLDAGCGTGNYSKAFIEYGVGHLTLLDATPGMLETARTKLADHIESGSISDIVENSLPKIPFPDASFDAVMFNLVLNHLDEEGDEDFPRCVETLKEARRVLKPNGVIVVSTILKSTALESMWFTQLDRVLGERNAKRLPSLEQFEHMFDASSISCLQKMNLLGTDTYTNYYDPESSNGPFDIISHYVEATESELNAAKQTIKELKEKGDIKQWCKENDKTNTRGNLTLFICQPKANRIQSNL